jgi:hypothetical protein
MEIKKTHKKNNVGKVFGWGFSVLLTLMILLIAFVYFRAEKIIKNNLSNLILEKTDSIYTLEFNEIKLNYRNRGISFTDIVLKPNSTLIEGKANKHYEFETNSLVISGINIRQILKEKKFHANSLIVHKPDFRFATGEEVEIEQFKQQKIEKGDSLYIPYIHEFLIDTILITDARIKMDTIAGIKSKTPQLNLEILDFKLGGEKITDYPFPFDITDIFLKVENFQDKLSDDIHLINVMEIKLSLLSSKILATNVLVEPIDTSIISPENQYIIKVPSIEIISSHVENFYFADHLPIEKLTFESPEIEIKFGNKIRKGTPLNEINLYPLIQKSFKWVEISLFSIKNAHVRLYPPGSDEVAQNLENLNVDFSHFRADESAYLDKSRILSSKNLNLNIEKFVINHTDKVHRLTIHNLEADTRKRKATTGKFSFKPISTSSFTAKNAHTIIDIESMGATFNGLKFDQLYHNQIIPMHELIIRSPEVNFNISKEEQQTPNEKDYSLLLEKISDYVRGIYVSKTKITNGKLYYNYLTGVNKTGFFRTNFNFELAGLSVDSITFYQSQKIFFASEFNVGFDNVALQLADDFHRLVADSIFLSSQGRKAEILNLKIIPIKTVLKTDSLLNIGINEIFDIQFPRISLTGADLHRAFFYKELMIDVIEVSNPVFNVELLDNPPKVGIKKSEPIEKEFFALVSNYLSRIKIESLALNKGELNISQHRKKQSSIDLSNKFSLKLYNFEVDSLAANRKNKLFFADHIDLTLNKQSFTLTDGVHKLDADEIGIISSQGKIYIKNAKMTPDIKSPGFKKMSVVAYATVPNIEFLGANIHDLINYGNFPVRNITISNPEIKLLFQPEVKTTDEPISDPQFLIPELQNFSTEEITIKNGNLELANYSNLRSRTFATTKLDFHLYNFKAEINNKKYTTHYTDFWVELKTTQFNFNDKLHGLTINKTNYKLSEGILNISDFKIQPLNEVKKQENKEYYSLSFPGMQLTKFDLRQFLTKKEIIASTLTLRNPFLEITDNRNEKRNSISPYKLNLHAEVKDFIEKIDINQIIVNNGKLTLNNNKPFKIEQLYMAGNSFKVDKMSDQRERFLSCNEVSLEIRNYGGKTKDGFYNFNFDKIRLNNNGDFSASGIKLTPAYSAQEFNQRKIFQDDYITILHADCNGNGLDIKRMIEKEELTIRKANFAFDKVVIYRNNHYPLPPNFRMNMPQDDLRNLKQKLTADTLLVACNHFAYTELEPHANSETKIFFTNLRSTLTNVSNIDNHIIKKPNANLHITAKLMGEGDLSLKIDMDLLSPENKYKATAECGPMPMFLLNSITEPSMNLLVKEGNNNHLTTYFEANEDSSWGQLRFSYSGLKISVLSEKEGVKKEDRFTSFLVNTLALRSDNPRGGRPIEPVQVEVKRDKEQSFINYLWISAFSGIKNTFGIKEKEEQP